MKRTASFPVHGLRSLLVGNSTEATCWLQAARQACERLHDDRDIPGSQAIEMRLHAATSTMIGNSPLLQSRANLNCRTARTRIHFLHRLDRNQEIDAFAFDADQTHNATIRGDIRAIGLLVRNAGSGVLIRLGQLSANARTDNLELK